MKIFLLSNMYPSKQDGLYGVFVKRFVEAMTQQGVQFCHPVLMRGRGHKLGRLLRYGYFLMKTSFLLCFGRSYQLIYGHYLGITLLPLRLKRCIKVPLVINAHGSDVFPESSFGSLIQRWIRPVVQQADLIIVPSPYFQQAVQQQFTIPAQRIMVSPSAGIDTQLFKPSHHQHQLNERIVVGFTGRITAGKGWDLLLKALHDLPENYHGLIIGHGDQMAPLQQQVTRLGLTQRVELAGFVPHHQLVNYYQRMDIFAFPTTRQAESLGLVGLEAMACGLPVVGSAIGGLQDYIQPNHNGWLFAPGDGEALVTALQQFITLSSTQRQDLAMNARQTALAYDSQRISNQLYQRLQQLCQN